jgi:uncharacterized membrane protein YdjX (TVP38/TMEM64 family)
LQRFLEWIAENPIAGPFLICIATALVVIWMCPYSILAIGSGYTLSHAYNNVWIVMTVGSFAVFIGAWLGGMVAFGIGRFCCRKQIKDYSSKKPVLRAIDSTMDT